MKTNIHFLSYLAKLFFERETFQIKDAEKITIHILYSIIFFFENLIVCGVIWKNILEPAMPRMKIWRMRIACWIPKAAHRQYIIFY